MKLTYLLGITAIRSGISKERFFFRVSKATYYLLCKRLCSSLLHRSGHIVGSGRGPSKVKVLYVQEYVPDIVWESN